MMRRLLVSAVAVPVLLLSACGSDEPEVVEPDTQTSTTTPAPADDAETTTGPAEPADTEETTSGDAAGETATDDAATTSGPAAGEVEGGEEGQAAADRAKEWLVAFVNGEDAVCDYMLDLSSEGPMTAKQGDYDTCVKVIPAMAGEMFPAEVAGIIELMEITGADVDGDTAVVDRDNFSELFAEGFGDDYITLRKFDGQWYVDMNETFTSGQE
ncbi:MAG TPA: hypothetical protein VK038_07995 [Ornithinicoccus sp.]|jgi:hypothetical protein|nr:hypothetical protein [Ornithinicoccus sp.]